MVAQNPALQQGRWLIGSGHQIPLSYPDQFQAPDFILGENNLSNGSVADLIDQEAKSWKVDLIRKIYHPQPAKKILLLHISRLPNMADKLIWKHSTLGDYM